MYMCLVYILEYHITVYTHANVRFKSALENVPVLRELIKDFYSSRYQSCFRLLDSLKVSMSAMAWLYLSMIKC